jgi:hypothetical protein
LHTTNLASGTMFILLGMAFIAYEGTSALSGLYEENGAVDLAYAAERWASSLAQNVPDALVLAALLAVVISLTSLAYRPYRHQHHTHGTPGVKDELEEISGGRRPKKANR